MTEKTQTTFGPGSYVLTVDLYPRPIRGLDGQPKDHIIYRKGDAIEILDPAEAQGLGGAGAIAPVGSLEAKRLALSAQGDPADGVALLKAEQLEAEAAELRRKFGGGEG